MNRLVSIRVGGIIVALALLLGLPACSAVKLGYNALPKVALWWLDGYLDFSDEQEPRARDAIAQLHAWHRRTELPQVIELLGRMEQLAPGEISPQQACGIVADVQARLQAIAVQAEPQAVALAATLTPRELRHLARKYRSNDERFQRDWIELTPEEQLDKRFQQMLARLESIYGTLDEPQRAVLRERLAATSWDPRRMLAQWEQRQRQLVSALQRIRSGGLAPAEAGALLRNWTDRLARPADPAYRAYQDALLQEGCATFSAVHHSTTPAQREQAARRLRAWQRDLRDLVAQQP
jgi:hypothetical protein